MTAEPARLEDQGYYNLPMVKRPLWEWQIALYFFFEGISAGCFVLAALAEFLDRQRHDALIRRARYVAFMALLPCPPLLIADLGRPERFHHMLRIFKPSSPMNLGAWTLAAYSQPVAILAATEVFSWRGVPTRLVSAAGLPLAFVMIAYPGVLLSTTSIPLWFRTRWLGPLLGSSSIASAASLLTMLTPLGTSGCEDSGREGACTTMRRIERAAHTVEAAALAAYIASSGAAARPLTRGSYSGMFRFGAVVGGMALPAVLSLLPRRRGRFTAVLTGVLSLAGALALKWAIVHAGRESAADSKAYRAATRAESSRAGWLTSPPAVP